MPLRYVMVVRIKGDGSVANRVKNFKKEVRTFNTLNGAGIALTKVERHPKYVSGVSFNVNVPKDVPDSSITVSLGSLEGSTVWMEGREQIIGTFPRGAYKKGAAISVADARRIIRAKKARKKTAVAKRKKTAVAKRKKSASPKRKKTASPKRTTRQPKSMAAHRRRRPGPALSASEAKVGALAVGNNGKSYRAVLRANRTTGSTYKVWQRL